MICKINCFMQMQCSLCEKRRAKAYQVRECGHRYCNVCLSSVHIPNENQMKCLKYQCGSQVDINDMDRYFVNLMAEALGIFGEEASLGKGGRRGRGIQKS